MNKKLRLLVVDDDDAFRHSLLSMLRHEKCDVVGAADLATARTALRAETFDAVFVDHVLPDGEGTDLLEDPSRDPLTEVVVITGYAAVPSAVAALHRGAVDYLSKPTDPTVLRATLARLAAKRSLDKNLDLVLSSINDADHVGAVFGRSPLMHSMFEMIRRVAPTDEAVLIVGESGTGKELVAGAIHELSPRSAGPLIAVNCGAIPENLLESELFGHEKGSRRRSPA